MKTVLLKYKNWMIVNDGGFPSSNYCLFNTEKAMKWREKRELPSFGVAYCSSLKNALTSLFQQLVLENCKNKKYEPNLNGLSDVITICFFSSYRESKRDKNSSCIFFLLERIWISSNRRMFIL